MLRFAVASLTAVCTLGCGPWTSRPNIILILADDMGWRDSRIYGSRFYRTRHIDALARSGMRFTNAYSASPLCSPTRASIVTGLDPARLRFTAPLGHVPEVVLQPEMRASAAPEERAITPASRTRLLLEYETIAERLRDAGYATGFYGKWHLGDAEFAAENRGFDEVAPGGSPAAPTRYFSPYDMEGLVDGPEGEHLDERLAGEAVSFVERHRGEPFVLFFWPFSVHFPYQVKDRLLRRYTRRVDPRDSQRDPLMAAMIHTLDGAVGTVVSAVEELGLREQTVIVFLSDNGGVDWNFDPNRPMTPTDNEPLRGGKGQLYDGGIRVPLIVSWPGKIQAGSVSREIVTSTDLYPTILELAGLRPRWRKTLDGVSIVQALGGGSLSREAIFFHMPHYMDLGLSPPGTAVRHGDLKLIRFFADADGQRDRLELYNLRKDPSEATNLALSRPRATAKLNAMIDAHLTSTSAQVPVPNPDYEPKRGDR